MTKDRTNIRIYGDDASSVAVAPFGTTGPTEANIEANVMPAGFLDVGWLTDDGVDTDRDETVNDFAGWQGGAIVRSKRTSVKDSFHIISEEENDVTLGLHFAGITPTDVTSEDNTTTVVTKWHITDQARSDPRGWLVTGVDGDYRKVYVVPNGEVTARATISHKNTGITLYDHTVTIYGDYDIYTIVPAP
ncbi:MAG TPA: hypothetical protein VFE15_15560 [Marmoricola sp.]|jgi:hypothetical protein|nr:hypothetical protein [Marmoricola sp.]